MGELPMFAQAMGMRAALPVLLRAQPLDRVLRMLTPRAPRRQPDRHALERIERVTDTVTRRIPLAKTACLHRALIRYVLLRRRGYDAHFVLGVRPAQCADGFEAHAWVTLQDRAIMEREPPKYQPKLVWPPAN